MKDKALNLSSFNDITNYYKARYSPSEGNLYHVITIPDNGKIGEILHSVRKHGILNPYNLEQRSEQGKATGLPLYYNNRESHLRLGQYSNKLTERKGEDPKDFSSDTRTVPQGRGLVYMTDNPSGWKHGIGHGIKNGLLVRLKPGTKGIKIYGNNAGNEIVASGGVKPFQLEMFHPPSGTWHPLTNREELHIKEMRETPHNYALRNINDGKIHKNVKILFNNMDKQPGSTNKFYYGMSSEHPYNESAFHGLNTQQGDRERGKIAYHAKDEPLKEPIANNDPDDNDKRLSPFKRWL